MEAEARRLIDAGQMPSLEQVLTVVAEGRQQQWGSPKMSAGAIVLDDVFVVHSKRCGCPVAESTALQAELSGSSRFG
jgi:hypothetical protein